MFRYELYILIARFIGKTTFFIAFNRIENKIAASYPQTLIIHRIYKKLIAVIDSRMKYKILKFCSDAFCMPSNTLVQIAHISKPIPIIILSFRIVDQSHRRIYIFFFQSENY